MKQLFNPRRKKKLNVGDVDSDEESGNYLPAMLSL